MYNLGNPSKPANDPRSYEEPPSDSLMASFMRRGRDRWRRTRGSGARGRGGDRGARRGQAAVDGGGVGMCPSWVGGGSNRCTDDVNVAVVRMYHTDMIYPNSVCVESIPGARDAHLCLVFQGARSKYTARYKRVIRVIKPIAI